MKLIPLTKGFFAMVDDSDFDRLNQFSWHVQDRGNRQYAWKTFYLGNYKSGHISMHRVILNAPDGVKVDHRDGNGLNNQRSNLRLCTQRLNLANRGMESTNTSGFKGVSWHKKARKWSAQINNVHKIHLGLFDSAIEAAVAYDEAAVKHFGEFAKTNEMMGRYGVAAH